VSFEDWKRERDAAAEEEEAAPPSSEAAPESEVMPESRAGTSVGRFDVAERSPGKLTLIARSRTDTFAVKWAVVVASVLLPFLLAASTFAVQPAPMLAGMFIGITVSVIYMIDFARVATQGMLRATERSFAIASAAGAQGAGYRTVPQSDGVVVAVDGREMGEAIRDVKVLAEVLPNQGGTQVFRVYVIFEKSIVTLEATRNRLVALRLASLVRNALGMAPLTEIDGELPTLGGCAMLFVLVIFELAVVAGGVVGIATASESTRGPVNPVHAGLIGVAMVACMFVVQRLSAMPMRGVMKAHWRENLGL